MLLLPLVAGPDDGCGGSGSITILLSSMVGLQSEQRGTLGGGQGHGNVTAISP